MMNDTYDIAVVGLGPAGATFARLIDRRYRVVAIDKKREGGFQKVCGGLLSSDAQKALAGFDLTLPKSLLVDPQIFAVRTLDTATGLTRYYQRFYLNLDRAAFDQWLMDLIGPEVQIIRGACESVTREKDHFALRAGGRVICARYVVGADGAGSLVRRALFPGRVANHYLSIQQWFADHNPNPFYSCVFDRQTSDACSWSICKDGYFIYGGAFALSGAREQFERQKQNLARFGFVFGEPVKTEACLVNRPMRPGDFVMGEKNAMLLGEAAGLISPSSFEGISWAMESGRILASLFSGDEGDIAARYRRATRMARARLLGKVLKCPFMYDPRLRALVMRTGLKAIDIKRGGGAQEA